MADTMNTDNTVFVQAAAQGPALDVIFVADFSYDFNKTYGTYLAEFKYGVTREYVSWRGRIPAEQLVGMTDSNIAQSIRHAELPAHFNCGCGACHGRVQEP